MNEGKKEGKEKERRTCDGLYELNKRMKQRGRKEICKGKREELQDGKKTG